MQLPPRRAGENGNQQRTMGSIRILTPET